MPTLWNNTLKAQLVACQTDAELLEVFPNHNLQNLKRRQREFRSELQVSSDPEDIFRVFQKREYLELSGLKDGTRIVVSSDYQIPYTDWATVNAFEAFVSDFQPDIDVLNGDILDCPALSVFAKNPSSKLSLNEEFGIARWMLDRRKKINPKGKIIWIDGNHEDRLVKTLWKQAPALYGVDNGEDELITIPHILGLPKRDITYLNYRSMLDIEGFKILHGFTHGPGTAKKMYNKLLSSGCVGHTHTVAEYHISGANGQHAFYEIGCMCRMDPDWTKDPYTGWTQGFLVATVFNHKLHTQVVPIYEDGFAVDGKFYPRKEE